MYRHFCAKNTFFQPKVTPEMCDFVQKLAPKMCDFVQKVAPKMCRTKEFILCIKGK